jgi:hypothetical protein
MKILNQKCNLFAYAFIKNANISIAHIVTVFSQPQLSVVYDGRKSAIVRHQTPMQGVWLI